MKTIVEMVSLHAKETPERPAVIFEDGRICYGELWRRAKQCARVFAGKGVGKGDCVIVQGSYTPFYPVAALAAHRHRRNHRAAVAHHL